MNEKNAPSLFDDYLIVDWSASNQPTRGKDSIWIGEARRRDDKIKQKAPVNPSTRSAAMVEISRRLARALASGRRIFIGFDFPFGYPHRASALIAEEPGWNALWNFFQSAIDDNEKNQSNRYALAAHLNRQHFPEPLYWGRPHQHEIPNLPTKKVTSPFRDAHELRIVERWQKGAKSVWQLAYNGAVGSQAMLGIARLEKLRADLGVNGSVWPFETEWDETLAAPVVVAEVYPSMIRNLRMKDGEVKDSAQVRSMARKFATLDAKGAFRSLLARPDGLADDENEIVLREEGWIVGAGRGIK